MRFIAPAHWRYALIAYLVGGLVLGAANPLLRAAAVRLNMKAGFGTAADVNLLLPLLAAVVAVWYPRYWTVWAGGPISGIGFHLGSQFAQNTSVTTWSVRTFFISVHPILVVACIGCAMIGTVAATAVRPWRVVGLADAAFRCKACGYLLHGLAEPRCPECGKPIDSSAAR